MESNDAADRRDELIREACRGAGQRLANASESDAALIATGELLFWIVAADDSMLKSDRPGFAAYRNEGDNNPKFLFQGLRYLRNVLAHESEAWELERSDIYLDAYTDMYGAWTWASLGSPSTDANDSMVAQHAAYEKRLAGRPVISTAQQALEALEEFWTRQ